MSVSFGARGVTNYLHAEKTLNETLTYPIAYMAWSSRSSAANTIPEHETIVHIMNNEENIKRFLSNYWETDHTGRYVQCDDTTNVNLISIKSSDTDGTFPVDGTWCLTLCVETSATDRIIYYGSKGGTLRSKAGSVTDIGSTLTAKHFNVGGAVYGGQENLGNAKVARAAIWSNTTAWNATNRAANAALIFAGTLPTAISGCIHYWPLNYDVTGTNNINIADSVGGGEPMDDVGAGASGSTDEPFTAGVTGRLLMLGVG